MSKEMELKVCRVCLHQTANISVFSINDEIQYSAKIMKCVTNVVVAEGDGLPDSICKGCAEELCMTYEFIERCEASDRALRCASPPQETTYEEPDIKPEFLKQEPFDEAEEFDDHFADVGFDSAEITETLPSCNDQKKGNVSSLNGKKQKRKYTKSLGFYERIWSNKLAKSGRSGLTQCEMCGYTANSKSALAIHVRTHTKEKPFICDYCGKRFNLKGSIKRHIVNRHTDRERSYVCETCGSRFYSKTVMETHVRTHTFEKPFSCTSCGRAFSQLSSLIRHKRIHTGEKPYSCNICKKKFVDKSQVTRHLVVHTGDRKYICELCNKPLKSASALRLHMYLHANIKPNVCTYCGAAFTQRGALTGHIRRVHSEKSGICDICHKSFSDLETHMRKHTGEKPLECYLCGQHFSNKRTMANHITIRHNNDGKFKCSVSGCLKTFCKPNMLEFHIMKYHTNHTPFVCHHCSRGFYRTSDLTRHLKLTHLDVMSKDTVTNAKKSSS